MTTPEGILNQNSIDKLVSIYDEISSIKTTSTYTRIYNEFSFAGYKDDSCLYPAQLYKKILRVIKFHYKR